MTFPIDFHFGAVTLPAHLVFDFLSFFIGWQYYVYLRKRRGDFLDEDARWTLVIGAAAGALIGSRLIAALESPSMFLNPPSLSYYIAGSTIVGGIAGGILGVEIAKYIARIARRTGDLFTLPLLVAIAIGRIGCFLTGVGDHTVGLPSGLPWAFDQGDGIARHPTSLYEIAFLLFFWAFLAYFSRKASLKEGNLFRIAITGYFVFRFFIDFIKPREVLAFSLSSIQLVAVIVAIWYAYSLWIGRKRGTV